ncbi:hypothetical protein BGP77_03565 [Saccharospirillum sp. MSK14-1]|uniref:hypothetical protein n=1 Tax=Saccharospirillum sp. MSK14-1 TaxID=1897632 RepID=UPI000D3A71F4|nr:hypothetical protein [Saccharospirillum sp. MSK14-1]PTY36388.1 hypothetical protein BGP77_03565 [Saccharospirillum sp. MSK14-1]
MIRTALWTAFLCATAGVQAQSFTGTAYALDSDRVLYQERHELTLEDGQPTVEQVRYVAPDGQLLAEKNMTYTELARPGYTLILNQPERTERVEPDRTGVNVISRKEGRLDWPDQTAVIDAGFHYFILDNFDALESGTALDFQFLTPSRLSWIALSIEPETPQGDQLVLQLRPQSRVLRWLVDPIELTYSRSQQRLLQYRGLTNLPNGDEGNFKARIVYQYPETAP